MNAPEMSDVYYKAENELMRTSAKFLLSKSSISVKNEAVLQDLKWSDFKSNIGR